jgi:hypothetical protein
MQPFDLLYVTMPVMPFHIAYLGLGHSLLSLMTLTIKYYMQTIY